jgi:hypothetical protein
MLRQVLVLCTLVAVAFAGSKKNLFLGFFGGKCCELSKKC